MGATTFYQSAHGKTPEEAFKEAVEEAQYDYGHAGYTGTIAEKNSFCMIDLPEGKTAWQYAEELLDMNDDRITDKWGDAGCIEVEQGEYLFFGWASE